MTMRAICRNNGNRQNGAMNKASGLPKGVKETIASGTRADEKKENVNRFGRDKVHRTVR